MGSREHTHALERITYIHMNTVHSTYYI